MDPTKPHIDAPQLRHRLQHASIPRVAEGRLQLVGRRLCLCLLALAGTAVVSASASAQSRAFDVQLFQPPPGGGSTFTIDRPEVPRHGTVVVGVAGSYARGALSRVDPDGEATDVVPHLAQLEALAALGLFERMELGVAMPLVLSRVAEDFFANDPSSETVVAPGDLRLTWKLPILRDAVKLWHQPLRVSARAVFSLPTGDDDAAAGARAWSAAVGGVAAWTRDAWTLSTQLLYRLRRRSAIAGFEQDDELHLAGGVGYALAESLSLVGDAQVRAGVGGRSLRANEVPAELDVGIRWLPIAGFSVEAGVGTGLLDGYGAPLVRAFTVLRYATEREPCPWGPEDVDGYQDGDFCADIDNDMDGIRDDADRCPNDAEDVDGFADGDGCPDHDNDADAVVDAQDACPVQTEDRDGYQDHDGCPEPDNDEDGVPDGIDECPMDPEDRDQYQDDDGCPEPGPRNATVTVTDTRILISERIYFDFDRDTIRSVSIPLLSQVASVIKDLPKSKHIRVEGYSDNAGGERYNLDLSYRRARSVVEYLKQRGVDPRRLEYRGYGSAHPVAPNDSPEGRALNRRVEFTIIEPQDRN